MSKHPLDGMKVAILVADGFEQAEMTEPRKALDAAGAETKLVSPANGLVRAWKHHDPADAFEVDIPLAQAVASEFDALLLPGGVINPDSLRMNEQAVAFVRDFVKAAKPVAAICHGPWMLIEADAVGGRTVTSWPSLRTDLKNAGAKWVDREVAVHGNLITGRKPRDLPAFTREMIKVFAAARVYA
ncbi:type 1 glutamine amidotransferase domain-containing protein [Variovorax sp. LARHSF232]